ncbi:hypothetical protein MTO96_009333 [Rhipicephalus appendiculatus]
MALVSVSLSVVVVGEDDGLVDSQEADDVAEEEPVLLSSSLARGDEGTGHLPSFNSAVLPSRTKMMACGRLGYLGNGGSGLLGRGGGHLLLICFFGCLATCGLARVSCASFPRASGLGP